MKQNIGKSIRNRLLNISQKENQEYMKVLVRFLHERLLYRISISPYKSHFLLKGSSLLFAFDMFKARPTIDIDLLGKHLDRDSGNLQRVFTQICGIECIEDGVSFDAESILLRPIAIEKEFPGSCVTITAHLDTIVQPISVDIGFGDVVTPYPLSLDYPLLLDDLPAIEINSYSLETLIAEKFHAMVERDVSNSRMKDFYDVFYIFKNHEIDKDTLRDAIINTFDNRNTHFNPAVKLFTSDFSNDIVRNFAWKAFLKKIRWKEEIPFTEVMTLIREKLSIYWNESL